MNVTVTFQVLVEENIVHKDVNIDIIIGFQSILYYNLPPLLDTHINKNSCCVKSVRKILTPVVHIFHDTGWISLNAYNYVNKATPSITSHPLVTERDFIKEFCQPWAPQHLSYLSYSENKATLFHHIQEAE